jgi:hypothetical protein
MGGAVVLLHAARSVTTFAGLLVRGRAVSTVIGLPGVCRCRSIYFLISAGVATMIAVPFSSIGSWKRACPR